MKVAITLAELKQLLDKKENILLIDMRNKEEYFEAHIPFAVILPFNIVVMIRCFF